MQPSPYPALSDEPTPAGGLHGSRQVAELVYEGMTIAAMLLLLCSLWVF
jgi:hypothetical protein